MTTDPEHGSANPNLDSSGKATDRRDTEHNLDPRERPKEDTVKVGGFQSWILHHRNEIILAFVFAVPFAWLLGKYFADPSAYQVVVLEYGKTDADTHKMFECLSRDWDEHLGRVPVNLVIDTLSPADTSQEPNDVEEQLTREAKNLVADGRNTVMVIGHLPSGLTEVSLPIFLQASPPVPYISTSASDDNLLTQCPTCSSAAVLQPSPRNWDQANAAIAFAIEAGAKSFAIVTDNDPNKDPYDRNLTNDFVTALKNSTNGQESDANPLSSFNMQMAPDEQERILRLANPDCIFYAGDASNGAELIRLLTRLNLKTLVIFSDSVIETRDSNAKISVFSAPFPVRFTYAANALEYTSHVNAYGQDAVQIARQLIHDLRDKGGDFGYGIRSITHSESAASARASLLRMIAANSAYRSSYPCDSAPDGSGACIFDAEHHRRNGLFHVWRLGDTSRGETPSAMIDIDGWHRQFLADNQLGPCPN